MVATSEVVVPDAARGPDRIRRCELSAVELTDAVLARTEEVEPRVHAYITLTAEEAGPRRPPRTARSPPASTAVPCTACRSV